jgi:hypothetical protein
LLPACSIFGAVGLPTEWRSFGANIIPGRHNLAIEQGIDLTYHPCRKGERIVKWVILCFCILIATGALAKDKPRITIQVVTTHTSERQYSYTIPGTGAQSSTNCNSNATAIDTGAGTATANGTTNCETTTTPGSPPQTVVNSIPQVHVYAVMPNNAHVTLWCQRGFRQCRTLEAGSYFAEVSGDTLWVYGHDLEGKEHKIKYHAVGGW